jgi:hypothetical protein
MLSIAAVGFADYVKRSTNPIPHRGCGGRPLQTLSNILGYKNHILVMLTKIRVNIKILIILCKCYLILGEPLVILVGWHKLGSFRQFLYELIIQLKMSVAVFFANEILRSSL